MKKMSAQSSLVIMLLLLSACGGYETLDIEPRVPERSGITVNAQWTIKEGSWFTGITSRGTGGACLVEAATDFGGTESCPNNDPKNECKFPATVNGVSTAKWFAYCSPDKKCWLKTSHTCNRSPDYPNGPRRWEKGTHTVSIEPIVDVMASYRPTIQHWRVVACLNGYDSATKKDTGHCGNVPPGVTPNQKTRWSRIGVIDKRVW